MKTLTAIIIVMLIGMLAFVPNVSATGVMDGSNWTGIDNILDSLGFSYLKNSTGMSNPATVDLNMNSKNIKNATIDWSLNNISLQNSTVNDTGLVLDMRFDENSTGMATSTKIYDSSKFSNDGIWYGYVTPNWTNGKYGGGLSFDGVDDYVDCGNDASLNILNTITVSAWVKMNAITADNTFVSSLAIVKGYSIMAHNPNTFRSQIGNGSAWSLVDYYIPEGISLNRWYFISTTMDSSRQKLYINGILKSDVASQTNLAGLGGNLFIGNSPGYSNLLNGTIDEVRIYNHALSAEEIRTAYYSNPLSDKSSFIQTDNFRIVNNSGYDIFSINATGKFTITSNVSDATGILPRANSDPNTAYNNSVNTWSGVQTFNGINLAGTAYQNQSFQNLLKNGDFESWSAGANTDPDGWQAYSGAGTFGRDTTHKWGTYSYKLINTASNALRARNIDASTIGLGFIGQNVTFGAWVNASIVDRVRLTISDVTGSGTVDNYIYSNYHSGSGNWEFLTVTNTNTEGYIKTELEIVTGAQITALFDSAILVEGLVVPAFSPRPLYDDGKTLTVDSVNNRVGINTIAPNTALHIDGVGTVNEIRLRKTVSDSDRWAILPDSTDTRLRVLDSQSGQERLTILNGGNVGIGTTNPFALLQLGIQTTSATPLIRPLILQSLWNDTNIRQQNFISFIATNSANINPVDDTTGEYAKNWHVGIISETSYYAAPRLSFLNTGVERVVIDNIGNVGINTTTPNTFKLEVAGDIGPDENNTRSIGSAGKNYLKVWATTFAGGEFADKAPGGYDYSSLYTTTYHSDLINESNILEGYYNYTTVNEDSIKYAAVELNTTNGKWDLASGFDSSESVAIIPNDDELIIDGRLIILGGYKVQVYGNITIGDKLIVSSRAGVLTNARGLTVPSLQYVSGTWQTVNLPVSTNPEIYNKYSTAQGVDATVAAIALESYNSADTGIINVKVLNT